MSVVQPPLPVVWNDGPSKEAIEEYRSQLADEETEREHFRELYPSLIPETGILEEYHSHKPKVGRPRLRSRTERLAEKNSKVPGVTLYKCRGCGKKESKMLRCSRCKSVYYCNTECQRAHWPSHKKICQ